MRCALLAAFLITLTSCGGGDGSGNGASADSAEASPESDSSAVAPFDTSAVSGVLDPDSPDVAAEVIRAYYDAIEARDYTNAYGLWGSGGEASGQSLEAFREGFEETVSVDAAIGAPGPMEGAAGSRYVELPVAVVARLRSGQPQCFAGTYTMRRSVVDGATAAQRSWRIASATMKEIAESQCVGRSAGELVPTLAMPTTAVP